MISLVDLQMFSAIGFNEHDKLGNCNCQVVDCLEEVGEVPLVLCGVLFG